MKTYKQWEESDVLLHFKFTFFNLKHLSCQLI